MRTRLPIIRLFLSILGILILKNLLAQTPEQPEFQSYEPFGASEMVHLTTGGFVYNLPLMEIPGQSGGFPIQLTYHGGIKLNQEASWVGLGWNLNVGSISRTVSQYPDDMHGAKLFTDYYFETSECSQVYGDVLGLVEFGTEEEVGWALRLLSGIVNKEQTVYSSGNSGYYGTFNNGNGLTQAQNMGGNGYLFMPYESGSSNLNGTGVGIGSTTFASFANIGDLEISSYSTDLSKISNNSILYATYHKNTKYKYQLEKAETIYGMLYQSDMPSEATGGEGADFSRYTKSDITDYINWLCSYDWYNTEAPITEDIWALSSDIYQNITDKDKLYNNLDPVHMAPDIFSVKGEDVTGLIEPIRFDDPSASYPLTINQTKQGFIRHKKYKIVDPQTTKVQFIYPDEVSNYYNYHTYDNTVDDISYFRAKLKDVSHPWCESGSDHTVYILQFNKANQPIRIKKVQDTRKGFDSSKGILAKSKYIEWFSNEEFTDNTAKLAGLINYTASFYRPKESFPEKGIGGFMIHAPNGFTYYYTIPVYNFKKITNNYENGKLLARVGLLDPYATTWLLTAITGPDFVDRGNIGSIDEADYGYYVKFEYGKFTDDFKWRTPYNGFIPSKESSIIKYAEHGVKQTYYLNKIITSTHTALFVKDYRKDGKSYYNENGGTEAKKEIRNSLLLKEIILIKNSDLKYAIDNLGFSYNGQNTKGLNNLHYSENVLLEDDITESIDDFFKLVQLKRVKFKTSYDLCNNTPNSFDFTYINDNPVINNKNGGKLTLNSVEIYGLNNKKALPSYKFNYSNNKVYSSNKWDGWGYYCSSSSSANRMPGEEGNAWNLKEIILPTGSKLEIKYERSKYNYINEEKIASESFGGGVVVKEISMSEGVFNKGYKVKYNYNNSGVCTQEPIYSRMNGDKDFYNYFKAPGPAILYGNIEVAYTDINDDIKAIEDYQFETPNSTLISYIDKHKNPDTYIYSEYFDVRDGCGINDPRDVFGATLYQKSYLYKNHVGKIGLPIRYVNKNSKGDVVKEIEYNYNKSSTLGAYTQACNIVDTWREGDQLELQQRSRLINTVSLFEPYILTSTKVTENNRSITTYYKERDFYTGDILKEEINTPENIYSKAVLKAYKIYPEMGPKALDENNKNMLTQQAANISYIKDGSNWEPTGVNVQTWNDKWNYRGFNGSSYTDNDETDVWRKHKQFVWKGGMNTDGTYDTDNAEFGNYDTPNKLAANWADLETKTDKWQQVNEITRYNHYSAPLESKDINGHYASVKMDLDNEKTIATVANASYRQFTFSGFENQKEGDYVEGEVKLKTAYSVISDSYSHTGDYSLRTYGLSNSFEYKVEGLENGYTKPYKISLWALTNSVQAIHLDVDVKFYNSSNSVLYTDSHTLSSYQKQGFGEWYLFDVITPASNVIPNADQVVKIVVNVTNSLSKEYIYVDDFRVHPIDVPMQSYVYDHQTGAVTAILDNNNIATKYEYDDAGKLKAVYKETPEGFKKASEYDYGYARPVIASTFSGGLSVTDFNNESNIAKLSVNIRNNDENAYATRTVEFKISGTKTTLTKTIPPLTTETFTKSIYVPENVYGNQYLYATLVEEDVTISKNYYISPGTPVITVIEGSSPLPSGCTLDFGSTSVNSPVSIILKVKNVGDGQLKNIYIQNPTSSSFSVSSLCSTTLNPGNYCGLTITFKPQYNGDKQAVIRINSNAPVNDPFVINIKGTGMGGTSGGNNGGDIIQDQLEERL